MKKRIATVAAIGVGVVLASLGVAMPAQAVTSCPRYACMWGDTNYKTSGITSGSFSWNRYYTDLAGAYYANTSVSADNSGSSASNTANWDPVVFYQHRFGGGASATLQPQQQDSDFDVSGVIAGFRDIVGSVAFKSELAGLGW
jgi:hypothetical protein